MATFPSSVLPDSFAKFCIQFFDLISNVDLTVTDSTNGSLGSFEPFSIYYQANGNLLVLELVFLLSIMLV